MTLSRTGKDGDDINLELASRWATNICHEYISARKKFPKFRSYHEGIGVLLEEFDELKLEVFRKNADPDAIRNEAIQVAAMALAMIVDFPLPSISEQGIR